LEEADYSLLLDYRQRVFEARREGESGAGGMRKTIHRRDAEGAERSKKNRLHVCKDHLIQGDENP